MLDVVLEELEEMDVLEVVLLLDDELPEVDTEVEDEVELELELELELVLVLLEEDELSSLVGWAALYEVPSTVAAAPPVSAVVVSVYPL